ncbi:AAA family ATPase [Candidatus Woesearchaeota archaeon]|nr:AAA family ATPase [Candidatus Woesearchaeota archaeon]
MNLSDIFNNKGLNLVYGEPATGKTTLALQLALNCKKAIFIDVEKTVSSERIEQIGGNIDNIIFLKPGSFAEQLKFIENLKQIKKVDLIVIDTIGYYYRDELKNDAYIANRFLDRQLKILKELAETGILIVINNQVYSDLEHNIKVVGGNMIRNWACNIIKLEKEPRKLIIEKEAFLERNLQERNEKEFLFEIKEKGINFL